MKTPPTNDDVVRAVASFALWNTTSGEARQAVHHIVQQYSLRLPSLASTLPQVEHLMRRLQSYRVPDQPQTEPIAFRVEDVPLLMSMLNTGDYVRAVAFTTLWRYGDDQLRTDIQTFLQSYCRSHPAFLALLKRTANDVTASLANSRHERTVVRL